MAVFVFHAQMRRYYFDRVKVETAAERAKARVLFRAAMTLRKYAIYSIKIRAKGHSKPGEPPYSLLGAKIRRWNRERVKAGKQKVTGFKGIRQIEAAYLAAGAVAIIGPYSRRRGIVPHTLEFGGTTNTAQYAGGRLVRGTARIQPRPFMGPARDRVAPTLPAMWRGSIRGD